MLALFRLRGLVYTLVGTLVLSTLWVTSLAQLTARPAATDLLTEVGTQVLNPFLVSHQFGMSQPGYATLEAAARAHPTQPLSLSGLKAKVLGREIVGLSYADATRVVYRHVAQTYYDGGAPAAFAIPSELQAVLNTYAMFNPSNLQQLPQSVAGQSVPKVPSLPQIPNFLQPLFTVTGLTPDTFTAAGHARLLGLLPFFWLALIIWMALTAVFDRSGNRFRALLRGAVHGTWPVVALLAGLWVLSRVYPDKFAPYMGLLGMVSRTVLLVYGGALAFGVVALVLLRIARRRPAGAGAQAPAMAMAGVPAMRGQAGAQMMQMMQQMQGATGKAGKAGMPQMQTPPSAQASPAPLGWQEPRVPRGWEQPSAPPPDQQPAWQQEWGSGQPNWQQLPSRQQPMGQPSTGQPMERPGWQQSDWQQPAGTPQMPQSPQDPQNAQTLPGEQGPRKPHLPTIPPEWEQSSTGPDARGTLPPTGRGSDGW